MNEFVGTERRPGEGRDAPAALQLKLAATGKVEDSHPIAESGRPECLRCLADMDAWPAGAGRGRRTSADEAGDA
jgi:hypothetical protein